jgi:ketosteroid isomerase-like protein
MPAAEPEQVHGLFEQAFNTGDLETLMALYEPDAALIQQPGTVVPSVPAPIGS